MKVMEFLIAATIGALLIAWIPQSDCSKDFRIGQTYAEIQKGPCPDIERQARWADSATAAYLCPSQMVVAVGDRHSGKMVGFFLWNGQ